MGSRPRIRRRAECGIGPGNSRLRPPVLVHRRSWTHHAGEAGRCALGSVLENAVERLSTFPEAIDQEEALPYAAPRFVTVRGRIEAKVEGEKTPSGGGKLFRRKSRGRSPSSGLCELTSESIR